MDTKAADSAIGTSHRDACEHQEVHGNRCVDCGAVVITNVNRPIDRSW